MMFEKINKFRDKMYFNFVNDEEKQTSDAMKAMEDDLAKVNGDFPDLINEEPMTHTITVDDVVMREDIPVLAPCIEILFSNAKNVNGREIEVPKVVE